MKAILLAGHEPRLEPLTVSRAAALLPVANRPLVAHAIEALPDGISEITLLCERGAEEFRRALGALATRVSVREAANGNLAGALRDELAAARSAVMVLNAHDRHSATELAALAQQPGWLQASSPVPCGLGAAPASGATAACVAAVHLTAEAARAAAAKPAPPWPAGAIAGLRALPANAWRPMIYPWHLIEANVAALAAIEASLIAGTVQPHVMLGERVVIGEGTLIKAGTTIEGPALIGRGCTIGPCAYIRPDTVIGNDCFLGHGFEIVDSVIFDRTTGKHRSYVGHSVIGAGVNFGAGFITSDFRHDGGSHVTVIGGAKVDSGRRKLGAFIGDGVKTGVHTCLYPGRKIWPGLTTLPGEVVEKDKRS